jgi:hypothetical protein
VTDEEAPAMAHVMSHWAPVLAQAIERLWGVGGREGGREGVSTREYSAM